MPGPTKRRTGLLLRCSQQLEGEAPEMDRKQRLAPPHGREADVLRAGREGVWWERRDGLQVRLAAPEREASVDRTRLSLFAMLVAIAAAPRSSR